MRVISYSLWGDAPVYTVGAIRNADLAKKYYPDWKCIFYCFSSVPTHIVDQLEQRDNCIVRMVDGQGDRSSAVERFFPMEEDGVDYVICRDTDSRISPREVYAVNSWMEQGTDIHIMRDHPYHGVFIPAGMWGAKTGKMNGISKAAKEFVSNYPPSYKFQDQDFLTSWVWARIKQESLSVTVHDPFFSNSPFPDSCTRGLGNDGVWFVGQVFDETDKYNSENDVQVLMGEMK